MSTSSVNSPGLSPGPLLVSSAFTALQAGFIGFVVRNLGIIFFATFLMESNLDRMEAMFDFQDNTYDFIIVGAGPSGCSLANRLSEKYKTLLLEAGGTPSPFLYIPVLFFNNQNNPVYDWNHRTVPQTSASFANYNNVSYWPAGKGLGGSSLINAMMYIRGSVQSFDKIANRTGNHLWRTENVLKYYKGLEDYHGFFDDGTHGKGGGVAVHGIEMSPFIDNLLKAGTELGFPIADLNPNGEFTERFSPMDYTSKNGRRLDVYSAFIEPVLHRKNLVVKKYSLATQVLFEGKDNRAIGIKYERHGKESIALARKEVILSAGGLHSAKILLLSGIGPKEHLDEAGIKQLIDLPVGTRLQDKYGALIGPFTVSDSKSFVKGRDLSAKTWMDFVSGGKGPYASTRLEGTYTFRSVAAKASNSTYPDIFTYVVAHSPDSDVTFDFHKSMNIRKDILESYYKTAANKDAFFQLVTVPRPKGYGFMKLKDKNPHTPLHLDPKYLQNKDDVKKLVEGIKFAVNLIENTTSFQEINAKMLPISFPGCESFKFKSDEYYECWARHTTNTAYKYCGTVPMGKSRETDPSAVVDPFLRVFGTTGLRVVDSAVLQEKEVSNNQITCQMVGALVSDWILDYWDNYVKDKNYR